MQLPARVIAISFENYHFRLSLRSFFFSLCFLCVDAFDPR